MTIKALNHHVPFHEAVLRQLLLQPWCWLVGHRFQDRPGFPATVVQDCGRCASSFWDP